MNIGISEVLVLAVVVLLLFQPDRLPIFAKNLGRVMRVAKKFKIGSRHN